jgi:beta-galactosidase
MIYHLKRGNFSNFEIYRENVLKPRAYFIPFSGETALKNSDIRKERYSSDMVEVLSGEWEFKYYNSENDIADEWDSENESFDKISVPSMWQFTGYEKPCYINTRYQFTPDPPNIPEDCALGIYRKIINIDDLSKNYILSFLGVAGAIDVFVNSHFVGYSEGSHNTSEFDIKDYLAQGENEIIAVVHKFSNGTYLEAQDMFRNNGIFRDVLLYKTGDNSIYDFEAKTSFNNDFTYDLNIALNLKLNGECTVKVNLFFDDEEVAAGETKTSSKTANIELKSIEAKEWNAEIPNLYKLVLTLFKDGKALESIARPIGFKRIKIIGNIFTFNGKSIKLLGVNHHDTHPKKGYVLNIEDMERDVKIFKDFNVNCVRTSHYPPDPAFLDLCDEYGIYVVDEADIETHGCQSELHKPGACSHNPKWQPRYWDRVLRMFERDKNHPSITMWSLGNEAWGYLNQDYCYAELKKLTPIPIHYEGVVRTKRFAYDVISMMYPWHKLCEKISTGKGLRKKFYQKPFFMCEYCHAMGLGAGDLEEYMRFFYGGDNMMGGCIWEFADHAVYHENGRYKYTYGGDHFEEKHDGNFCVDGLFFPDRTPHSGAYQMKNCYRPVRAEFDGEVFIFKNLLYFSNAKYTVRWNAVGKDGETTGCGEFDIDVDPRGRLEVKLGFGECDAVILRYYRGAFEIASEQIDIYNYEGADKEYHLYDKAPKVINSQKKLIVEFEGGELVFNTKTGEVESYCKNSNEFINRAPFGNTSGFGISVFRAPIDNDRKLQMIWNKFALDTEKLYLCDKIRTETVGDTFVIEGKYKLSTTKVKELLKLIIRYNIKIDGSIKIDVKCLNSKKIPFVPRFGLTLEMPREYDNVKYFGLGDMPNLPDYKEHAMLGTYECKVDELRENYIRPQESSMRSDVRYAEITDDNAAGLRFTFCEGQRIFSADHFTSRQCAKAAHQEEIKLCDTTAVHLDYYQLGAGSGACGPFPTKEYRLNSLKGIEFSICVEVI